MPRCAVRYADSVAPRAEYGQPDVYDSVLNLFTIQAAGFDRAGSFLGRGAATH